MSAVEALAAKMALDKRYRTMRGVVFLLGMIERQDQFNIPVAWRAENLTDEQAVRIAGRLHRAHLARRRTTVEDLNPAIQAPDRELGFKQRSMAQMLSAIKKSDQRRRARKA